MKWNHKYYKKLQIGIDAFSLLLSLLVAVFIKKGGFVFPKTFYDFSFILLLLFIWFVAANECRLYRNRINKKFPEEILYTIYTNILFLILVSSFLFLSKSVRRSVSWRHLLLFLASVGLMLYNPEVLYLPLLSWAFVTLFLKTDRAVSLGWLIQVLVLGAYMVVVHDVTFVEKLLLVVAFLAIVPLKITKKRASGKQKARS